MLHQGIFPFIISSQLGIQSHILFLVLAFRVVSQFRHSEPPLTIQAFRATFNNLGIQSHLAQFRHSEPPLSVQVFKATLLNSTFINLGVQSHLPQFKHSEPPLSIQAFKATLLSLGIQSHLYQFKRLEPLCSVPISLVRSSKPLFSIQAFRATLLGLGVQSHLYQFRHSKSQFSRVSLSRLFVIQSVELITCVLIISLVLLTSCPCIEHMYFSFYMCSFLCSLVVWLLLDFDIVFQVTFGDFFYGVWIHSVALEAPQEFRFLTCLVFIFLRFLKPVCSCFGLREHVSYYDKFGGLSCFSVEPTSFHLCIHFTCELN